MTTLLLNETLVKFPLLSDGSERNSLSLILSKLASVCVCVPYIRTWAISFFFLSHSCAVAHFYYYRESQTIHFIYSHAYIFNINISCGIQTRVENTSFYASFSPAAPHCGSLVLCAEKSIKNLNTTEIQAFRIVKIFQWVI